MSQRRSNPVAVVMFVMTCAFGLLYILMAAFTAIPACVAKISTVGKYDVKEGFILPITS